MLVTSLAMMLSACAATGGAEQVLPEMGKDEQATIKVTYWDEESFFRDLGNLFLVQHPNIDIEVVSTNRIYKEGKDPMEAMKEFIEEEQPDVLMLDTYNIKKLIDEGMLYPLDPVIAQDEFDLEGILPAAIEAIRKSGDGKLYGLAPTFYSSALYYNKSLFDKHGVPLPSDGMTWAEVLQLAERFPKDGSEKDRIYGLELPGFGGGNDSWRLMQMGAERGLSYVDPSAGKVTLNTDSWKEAANLVLKLSKSEAMFKHDPNKQSQQFKSHEDFLLRDPFIGGRVAMKIDGMHLMRELREATDVLKEKFTVDWDIVTVPVHPENPTVSSSFGIHQIYGINAKSQNLRAAWEFVKYINSDTMARVTARAPVWGGLPVRTEYIRNEEGKHLEAFYALEPSTTDTYSAYRELPQSFNQQFHGIVSKHWENVVNEKVTVDEALASIETEAQAALDQALEEEAAKKDGKADEGGQAGGAEAEPESSEDQPAAAEGDSATTEAQPAAQSE